MPNPDIPDWLIHFTGRPASFPRRFDVGVSQAEVAAYYEEQRALPERRMHGIFTSGGIIGGRTHGASGPVVCFSELTISAIVTQIRTGFVPGRRPPYAPWALVFNKAPLVNMGVRPVLYLSQSEMANIRSDAPASFWDRCVRTVPGDRNNDWSHEREWRLCQVQEPEPGQVWGVPLSPGLIRAVIVGRSGWIPNALHADMAPNVLAGVERWLFDAERGPVADGWLAPPLS